QVRGLHVVESEHVGEAAEHLPGGLHVPALLEPGVPGHAHPGEHRDLLATQPRRAAAIADREPHVLGTTAFPSTAQERSQLPASLYGRHATILADAPPGGFRTRMTAVWSGIRAGRTIAS